MNLLRATVSNDGSSMAGDGFEIPVPKRWKSAVSPGQTVSVGVRPEHLLAPGAAGEGPMAPISASIEVVEPLGHENIVHGKIGSEFVTAAVEPQVSPKVGDRVDLSVEVDSLHLFDGESKLRLDS
jgi:multiple sugar transport system ATP-binding protein